MKKSFKLDEIDCANCARELQDELAKLDGVKSVSVNFMTQKLTLEADDAEFDAVLNASSTLPPTPSPTARSSANQPSPAADARAAGAFRTVIYERLLIHSEFWR